MKNWHWVLVIALLGVSVLHRWHGIDKLPPPHASNDEYHYAWGGISLWETGQPVSWSLLGCYGQFADFTAVSTYPEIPFYVVCPAVDHPPLFYLLVGGFAWLTGAQGTRIPVGEGQKYAIWEIDLGRLRILALLLYAITFFLLFDLARQVLPLSGAMLTLVFYAFIGHVVVHGRLLVTEHLYTALFLLNVTFLQRYLDERCSVKTFGAVTMLTVAAALLTKLIAAAHGLAIVGVLLIHGRRRELLYPIAGLVIGLAVFFGYGWVQGWTIFWEVLKEQSRRFHEFASLGQLLASPRLVHDASLSYPLLVGWITLFVHLVSRQGPQILYALVFYMLGFFFFVSSELIFGWYLIFAYPFLCLSLAAFVDRVYRRMQTPGFVIFALLFLPEAFQFLLYTFPRALRVFRYGYLFTLVLLGLASFFAQQKVRTTVIRFTIIVVLTVVMAKEFWSVWTQSSSGFGGMKKVSFWQGLTGVAGSLEAAKDVDPEQLQPGLLVRRGSLPFWQQQQRAEHEHMPELQFSFSAQEKPFASPYWLWYHGYVKIPTDGLYVFALNSDDGSQLWLDGQLIVDNWGEHGPLLIDNVVRMESGYHSFDVRYYDNGVGALLELSVKRPAEQALRPLPPAWLWCNPAEADSRWPHH